MKNNLHKLMVVATVALIPAMGCAHLVCHYQEPINHPFQIDLKACFKKFNFPFPQVVYYTFKDGTLHSGNFSIQGHFLKSNGIKVQPQNLTVLKRNYTLSMEGGIDIRLKNAQQ